MTYDLRIHLIITLTLALVASACTSAVESPGFTKEEARSLGGRTDLGEDLCRLEGWYGDGECDEFCLEADAACDSTCLAYPSCEASETAHERWEDCPADASCREVTTCGATIWCSDTGATCLAHPSCDEGEAAHERWEDCPADASCREVTTCGATIWCSADEAPVCAGDNPEGCFDDGDCEEGFTCDDSMGGTSSACTCEPETGTWVCTPDLSGGICVGGA